MYAFGPVGEVAIIELCLHSAYTTQLHLKFSCVDEQGQEVGMQMAWALCHMSGAAALSIWLPDQEIKTSGSVNSGAAQPLMPAPGFSISNAGPLPSFINTPVISRAPYRWNSQ